MFYELDHIFVCASVGAPEALRLVEFGLREGSSNHHPGQGTANRRFFFHNAMLELLWISDQGEAQSPETSRTRLWERWSGRERGTCPFGFCFRRSDSQTEASPFPAWEYRPKYLPHHLHIAVATNSDLLSEPMLIDLPFAQTAARVADFNREPITHPADLQRITGLELVTPRASSVSSELQGLVTLGLVTITQGDCNFLNLEFDHKARGKTTDLRPFLPLAFFW